MYESSFELICQKDLFNLFIIEEVEWHFACYERVIESFTQLIHMTN